MLERGTGMLPSRGLELLQLGHLNKEAGEEAMQVLFDHTSDNPGTAGVGVIMPVHMGGLPDMEGADQPKRRSMSGGRFSAGV